MYIYKLLSFSLSLYIYIYINFQRPCFWTIYFIYRIYKIFHIILTAYSM